MTEMERMNAGKLHYYDDPEINAAALSGQLLLARYNATAPDEEELRSRMLPELLGKVGSPCTVKPPFRCDYGKFIEIGDGSFLNFDCVILDASPVKIGKHVMIGPRCCLYTASHPIDAAVRAERYDISKPVTICDNVWLGGNVVVNPGVTIGKGSIIGSGSVVTKDVPAGVIAAGNPCRVIREITEEDALYWQRMRDEYLADRLGASER